jgi:casein kinase II subunit alpha
LVVKKTKIRREIKIL